MDTKEKTIWVAGFIDADGTITIKRQKRGRSISYVPYISLGQSKTTNKKEAIKLIKEMFDGNIYEYKTKSNSHRLDVIQWSATSITAYEMAKKLLPFLIVRKQQAQILIEFYEKCLALPFHRISPEEQKIRADFFEKMRKHNVRGKLRYEKRLSGEGDLIPMQQSEH